MSEEKEKKKFEVDKFIQRTYQIVGIFGGLGGIFYAMIQFGIINLNLKETIKEQKTTNNKLDTLIGVTADRKNTMDTLLQEVNRDENISKETKQKVENLARDEKDLNKKIDALVREKIKSSGGTQGIVYVESPTKQEPKPQTVSQPEKPVTKEVDEVSDGFSDDQSEGFAASKSAKKKDEVRRNAARKNVAYFNAVLWGDQEIQDKGTVMLRLPEPMVVGGISHPKNTRFTGIAEKQSGRVYIKIAEINGTAVDLSVYELESKSEGLSYRPKFSDSYKVLVGTN